MDRGRLAAAVKRRRLTLGLSHEELAAATGLTRATISKIENGHPVASRSLYKLDHGLQWDPSSAETILQGGNMPDPAPPTRGDAITHVRQRRGNEAADGLAELREPWFWIEYGRFVAEDRPELDRPHEG